MDRKVTRWINWKNLCWVALVGAVGYFLFVEHGEHLFPILPYLILLACPLMHLLMHSHGKHGGHHPGAGQGEEEAYRRGLEEGRRQGEK